MFGQPYPNEAYAGAGYPAGSYAGSGYPAGPYAGAGYPAGPYAGAAHHAASDPNEPNAGFATRAGRAIRYVAAQSPLGRTVNHFRDVARAYHAGGPGEAIKTHFVGNFNQIADNLSLYNDFRNLQSVAENPINLLDPNVFKNTAATAGNLLQQSNAYQIYRAFS